MRRTRGGAYSLRYTAVPRPRGTATIMANRPMTMLPSTMVRRSKRSRRGNQPGAALSSTKIPKSHPMERKKSIAPRNRTKRINALINTVTIAAPPRTTLMRRSRARRRGSPWKSATTRDPLMSISPGCSRHRGWPESCPHRVRRSQQRSPARHRPPTSRGRRRRPRPGSRRPWPC